MAGSPSSIFIPSATHPAVLLYYFSLRRRGFTRHERTAEGGKVFSVLASSWQQEEAQTGAVASQSVVGISSSSLKQEGARLNLAAAAAAPTKEWSVRA